MPKFAWTDLAEAFLPGYSAGTWFAIDDRLSVPPIIGARVKAHPHVLTEDYLFGSSPAARTFFRSTSGGQIQHPAHPKNCSERCIVDKAGWIVTSRRTVSAEHLKGNYSCIEPNTEVLSAIMAAAK
jgi:hypothetical protein